MRVMRPPRVEPAPSWIESLLPGAPRSKPRLEPLARPRIVEPSVTAEPSKRLRVAPLATLTVAAEPTERPAPRAPWETVSVPPFRLTGPAMETRPRPVLVRLAWTREPTVPLIVRAAKRLGTLKLAPAEPTVTFWVAVVVAGVAWTPTPA